MKQRVDFNFGKEIFVKMFPMGPEDSHGKGYEVKKVLEIFFGVSI